MSLKLQNCSAQIHSQLTLKADLEIKSHITALFGPSGAGKTSLLEIICGLRQPDRAFIQLNDLTLEDTNRIKSLAPAQRQIGYVPQDLALFPHLSVKKNIFYSRQTFYKNSDLLKELALEPLLNRSISSLSGGEKQRVALARALMTSPKLLLLDEPLGSLDYSLKYQIMLLLKKLQHELKIPILYVTHNLEEVEFLCDEVVLIENGHCATPSPVTALIKRLESYRFQPQSNFEK